VQRDLVVDNRITIPRGELAFSFARSSGPGGQNVNKVNTKAQLRWGVTDSAALPDDIRRRLLERYANRVTNAGELLIESDRHREQGRNVGDCVERLRAMILSVARPPKRRRPTRPSRSANEARLRGKRQRAERKKSRRPPSED